MRIYYVGKNSSVKGPCDIHLADGSTLDVGDICIMSTDSTEFPSVVYSITSVGKWKDCQVIMKSSQVVGDGWSNFLLFAFDGIKKRVGKISQLKLLLKYFEGTILESLLLNAIAILEYNCDYIDASFFVKIYESKKYQYYKTSNKTDDHNIGVTPEGQKYFVNYLPGDIRKKLYELIESNIPSKEAIKLIRKNHAKHFRKAFLEFINSHPSRSIYDGLSK